MADLGGVTDRPRRWLRRTVAAGAAVVVAGAVAVTVLAGQAGTAGGSSTVCTDGAPTVKVPTLDATQTTNAATIVRVAGTFHAPQRAAIVAVAVAYQEAKLRNLASRAVPTSTNYPHDAVAAGDADSVGLFQQRAGWGTVQQRMTPQYAAGLFYRALLAVPGWQRMPVTVAGQAVERSAHPTAYAQWELLATQTVAVLLNALPVGGCAAPPTPPVDTTGRVADTIRHALAAVGTMYSFGGSCADPQSPDMALHCDCSSLVQTSWAAGGVSLPRTSEAQYATVPKVASITAANVQQAAQPGMLLFYEWGEDGVAGPGHVALALGDGYLVEAPQPGEPVHVVPVYTAGFVSAGTVLG